MRRGFTVVAVEAIGRTPRASTITSALLGAAARPAPRSRAFPTWMWRNRSRRAAPRGCTRKRRGRDPAAGRLRRPRPLQSLHVDRRRAALPRRRRPRRRAHRPRPLRLPHALAGRPGRLRPRRRERGATAAARPGRRHAQRPSREAIADQHRDGERFLEALQNARVVANAERYYRATYYGSRASWISATSHMFETLQLVLAFRGWRPRRSSGSTTRRRERRRDRDERARRAQVGQLGRATFRRRGVSCRLRHRSRYGRGRDRWGRADGGEARPAGARRELRAPLPRRDRRGLHAGAPPCAPRRRARRAHAAVPRARDRRDLPAGDRAREPLFPGRVPAEFDEYVWFDETPRRDAARTRGGDWMPRPIRSGSERGNDDGRRAAASSADVLPLHDVPTVLGAPALDAREEIWPNGLRYLWTDAFGGSCWSRSSRPRRLPTTCRSSNGGRRGRPGSAPSLLSASARRRIATDNTSMISRCGCTRRPARRRSSPPIASAPSRSCAPSTRAS